MKKTMSKVVSVLCSVFLLSSCSAANNSAEPSDSSDGNSVSSVTEQSLSDNSDIQSEVSSLSSEPVSSASASVSSVTSYENIYPVLDGTRDPWLWPFSRDSIWNMPLGSNAQYEKAGFATAYCINFDEEIHCKTSADDPVRSIYNIKEWGNRWIGGSLRGTMNLPDDLIIPDAVKNSTPNNCSAFLMPDGKTLKQMCATTRISYGSDICGFYNKNSDVNIYGAGIRGGHGGSGMSSIGGSIRPGELTSDEPIRHALKINVWANKYCYYGADVPGYVWPADRCDSYASDPSSKNRYGGSNKRIAMGTLLALPRDITPESIGVKTEVGKKIFYALQDYGAYIVDDSAWNCYALSATYGVNEEVRQKYGYPFNGVSNNPNPIYNDMQKIIRALCIITNNSSTSVGGGGIPCQPLAPDFAQ
jgi:hypothetical protein